MSMNTRNTARLQDVRLTLEWKEHLDQVCRDLRAFPGWTLTKAPPAHVRYVARRVVGGDAHFASAMDARTLVKRVAHFPERRISAPRSSRGSRR